MSGSWKHTVAIVAVLALLMGCGGGSSGSGGGLSNASVTGPYTFVCLTGSLTAPTQGARFGTITTDGSGGYTGVLGSNNGTTSTAPVAGATGTYFVLLGGALQLDSTQYGGMNSDVTAGVAAETDDGTSPSICVLLKRVGTYSEATMSGNYHHGFLASFGPAGGSSSWSTTALGSTSFDGLGQMTYATAATNDSGTQSTTGGGSAAYSLTAAGDLTVSTLAGNCLGGATADGVFAVAAGALPGAGGPALTVFLKKGSGMNASAFSGSYFFVALESDPTSSHQWRGTTGLATADGTGTLSIGSTTVNTDGVITQPTSSRPFTVGADGTLTSQTEVGGVSQDGRFAFLCGGTTANSSPAIYVFIRQ